MIKKKQTLKEVSSKAMAMDMTLTSYDNNHNKIHRNSHKQRQQSWGLTYHHASAL